ncbi:voltage-gated chloride channel protein [Alkalibaculum sp. M08DMB]|uniref:Voltage-gated chloride channel protein n=1 Tax=Alkalibaculum sporogenes TaxID=2655001 RepID=A0A6A7K7S4_9FIRM|nr:voltage-gated chloride channel family protein [Alkalibaculum sporogenes]MPW25538.1 voltage-gated chloride channel protein [Alkalibaculum sporogenes]
MDNKINLRDKSKYMIFTSTLIKWVFWGSIVGVAVGSTSALLLNANDFLTDTRNENNFLLFLLPLGGILIGYIYRYHGANSRRGNDLILEYIHNGNEEVPLRMGPIVYVSTFITHLLGGSTGREGAAIQMGTSIAQGVNRLFKVDKLDRKILIMCGISGGFGSAFGTPITGTIFGMEVIALGKMKYESLVPCFVSSFVGHFVAKSWGVEHSHHIIKIIPDINTMTIIKIILVSIIFSFVSVLYSQLRHGVKNFSEKYLKNLMIRGMIGGIIIILLTYLVGSREYLGRGLPMIDKAFDGQVPPLAFLIKIVFTAITMGMGFRGGEVIPLFFVGATLGNTLSNIVNLPTSFLAAIGLIAVFCGASNVPIACFVFSIELFEGKGIIFFFISCIVSYLFSGHHGIYASQKIYEPKSRLLNLIPGEIITAVEGNKKNTKT